MSFWSGCATASARSYVEGAEQPRVMGIAIHSFLSGVPHRIKYLEQALDYIRGHEGMLFWTGEQLLEWHRAQTTAAAKT